MEAESSTNSLSTHGPFFATENLGDAAAVLTHPSPVAGVLYSPPQHGPPPTPLSLTRRPALPLCLHINTVIDHPHVPVNLLMRRHGSCRVPLPPWGRMTRLHILFSPTPTAWWTAAPNWPTELATGRLGARWDKHVACCDAGAWEIWVRLVGVEQGKNLYYHIFLPFGSRDLWPLNFQHSSSSHCLCINVCVLFLGRNAKE